MDRMRDFRQKNNMYDTKIFFQESKKNIFSPNFSSRSANINLNLDSFFFTPSQMTFYHSYVSGMLKIYDFQVPPPYFSKNFPIFEPPSILFKIVTDYPKVSS